MANNINPINVNSQAISYSRLAQQEKAETLVNKKQNEEQAAVEKKEVPAADVLKYMAAQSIDVQPKVKKTLDISKYVTPEQAERIAGFVQGFEEEVEKGLLAFDKEFPGSAMSDAAKMNIVVDMFNKNNLE